MDGYKYVDGLFILHALKSQPHSFICQIKLKFRPYVFNGKHFLFNKQPLMQTAEVTLECGLNSTNMTRKSCRCKTNSYAYQLT